MARSDDGDEMDPDTQIQLGCKRYDVTKVDDHESIHDPANAKEMLRISGEILQSL